MGELSFPKTLPYYNFEFIVRGSVFNTYRVFRRRDNKIVIVKIPNKYVNIRIFNEKMQLWSRLNHPNIAKLYDYGTKPIFHEIEHCGKSLNDIKHILNEDSVLKIIFDVSEGLRHAHNWNIIHRNITPANIMVKDEVAKLSNLYCARFVNKIGKDLQRPYSKYLAPEQILGKREGFYTDIWQLGILFYELMTKSLPFRNKNEILKFNVVHPNNMINKCLNKRRSRRYQTVEEFQKDLRNYISNKYQQSSKIEDKFRTVDYCGQLILMYLKSDNGEEAYKYIGDLINYAKGDIKNDLIQLKKAVKYRVENNIPIPYGVVASAEVIIHKVKLGFKCD